MLKPMTLTALAISSLLASAAVLADGAREHGHAHQRISATERSPQQPFEHVREQQEARKKDLRKNVSEQSRNKASSLRTLQAQAVAACASNDFTVTGQALVDRVASADAECLNDLFSLSGTLARDVFRESQMVTIANAMRARAQAYAGSNSNSMLQMASFLRAGYYVQYYKSADVGSYGSSLKSAIQSALDAFFANSSTWLINDANGEVLAEVVTLVDSSTENARYLSQMKRLLNNFNATAQASWYMRVATNNVFTVMFRGHQNADFRTLVQADNSIIDTLYNFYQAHRNLLGGEDAYLPSNAAREMARFLQHSGSLKTLTSARVKTLLSQTQMTGTTSVVWVGLADMVDTYDKANCASYGTCNYKTDLLAVALPIQHTCSSTLRIRAQQMNSSELSSSCSKLATQETWFHSRLETGRTPIAGDVNAALELVIFNSPADYQTYAGALYGIDTNNGGMYLEGTPTQSGNQARFIAYEADWLLPEFKVWNLEHEYTHYLDGRFNMKGGFNDYLVASTVWWIEGMAEYIALKDNNETALDTARTGPRVALSTIFRNDYNSGTTRVYRWGYLAARFMFERKMSDVRTLLGHFRAGNYTAYSSFLNNIGYQYDSEFNSWLDDLLAGGGGGGGGETPVALVNNQAVSVSGSTNSETPWYIDVPANTASLTIDLSSGTGDADLYVKFGSAAGLNSYDYRPYKSGNAETVTVQNPQAGRWHVMLHGYNAYSGASLKASLQAGTPPPDPSCGSDPGTLYNGCTRSGLSGGDRYYAIFVPQGAKNLKFETFGGSGNADLYVGINFWPSASSFHYKSNGSSNTESIALPSPYSGYWYMVLVKANSAYSNLSIKASYTQ